MSENESAAFLDEYLVYHNSPVVVPSGEVVLAVDVLVSAPIEAVDLVVQTSDGEERIAATQDEEGWAATVEVDQAGIRYRFEITTSRGVVALPVNHGFVPLYTAGEQSVDISEGIIDLVPSEVATFHFGSGDREFGRSEPRSEGAEGLDTGPSGFTAISDGRVAVFDSWNGRVLVIDPTGQITAVPVGHPWGGDLGDPVYSGFDFSDDGQGAYTDLITVFTISLNPSTFDEVALSGLNGIVGDPEIHGNNIVARFLSGQYRVIGTFDGSSPGAEFTGLPTTAVLNELFDTGVYLYLPGSTIGHLTYADAELIPIAGRNTNDGGAIVALGRAGESATLLVRVMADGNVRTCQLVDESGSPFVPSSALDRLPRYAVSPDGSAFYVLTCSQTECALHTFQLTS